MKANFLIDRFRGKLKVEKGSYVEIENEENFEIYAEEIDFKDDKTLTFDWFRCWPYDFHSEYVSQKQGFRVKFIIKRAPLTKSLFAVIEIESDNSKTLEEFYLNKRLKWKKSPENFFYAPQDALLIPIDFSLKVKPIQIETARITKNMPNH